MTVPMHAATRRHPNYPPGGLFRGSPAPDKVLVTGLAGGVNWHPTSQAGSRRLWSPDDVP
jgi:hypothetical protein